MSRKGASSIMRDDPGRRAAGDTCPVGTGTPGGCRAVLRVRQLLTVTAATSMSPNTSMTTSDTFSE